MVYNCLSEQHIFLYQWYSVHWILLFFLLIFNPKVTVILCISFVLVCLCVLVADKRSEINPDYGLSVELFWKVTFMFNCTTEVIIKYLFWRFYLEFNNFSSSFLRFLHGYLQISFLIDKVDKLGTIQCTALLYFLGMNI